MLQPRLLVANDEVHELGEGPVWDPVTGRVLWVDIRRGLVLSGQLEPTGHLTIVDRFRFDQTIGAVAPARSGDLLLAGAQGLLVRRADGRIEVGPQLLPGDSRRRLNDGKPDPLGRFVVGSLSLDGESESEALWVTDAHGAVSAVLDDDLTLSNGLAWSADGGTLYSVDSLAAAIYSRPYSVSEGRAAGPRTTLIEVADGYPDGLCLDTEGYLWIAMWGLGAVHRYSPEGVLTQTIEVPAPHVSCVAFVGEDLETLVITTATQDLTEEQLEQAPLSGRIFTTRPGVSGAPQAFWAGRP